MPTGALAAPLANDAFEGALELTGAAAATTGSNTQASAEAGEPRHAGYTASRSVWWRWTAPASGPVRIDTCGSSFDTVLAVYSNAAAGDLGALTEVASTDDSEDCGLQSVVGFQAQAGETYAIAVDGYAGATGEIALQLGGVDAPANDHFADSEDLDPSLGDGYRTGTTLAATLEPDEPDHAGAGATASVWYRWTASESATMVASTCGGWWSAFAGSDTVLAAYTGTQLADLVELAANDDGGGCFISGGSRISFPVTAGTEYHVAVAGKGDAAVDFELDVSPPPLNDAFDAAETITDYAYGSTARATSEPDEPAHAGNPAASSLWYRWTAATDAPVEVALCAYEPLDPRLAIYAGDELTALADVTTGQTGGCSGVDETGVVATFEAQAGETYRIAVDSLGGLEGHFELSVTDPPANDLFADALELGESGRSGRNTLASKETGEPDHAGDAGGRSLWYRWTAHATGEFALATCTANFDTLLAVYSGAGLGDLAEVASNDDSDECGEASTRSSVRFDAVAGQAYWIAVDGKDGATGRFSVYFHSQPYNDPFEEPDAIAPGSWGGTTTLATKQPGEPDHAANAGGHSVWYRWSAARAGAARVSVCEADFDTLLAVYRRGPGDGLESLAEVASNDDTVGCGETGTGSQVGFQTEAGADYLIAVDGKDDASGDFELELGEAPANDAFAAATTVTEAPYYGVSAYGSNVEATKEDGEPDHAETSGGHSVWYRWTAPSSGSYAVETCEEATLDTVLAVYTGTPVSDLTEVGSNDDGCGGDSTASVVLLEAQAGVTYSIAVDGKGGATGSFTLRIAERPANDDLAAAEPLASRGGFLSPGTVTAATKEVEEPDHAGNPGGHSVWYRWTATQTGTVEVTTCQSYIYYGHLDTVVAVYSGAEYGALTPVASNDDTFGCGDGTQSRVVFTAVEGTEYRIAVDGKDGTVGNFRVALYDAPANDAFENATSLTPAAPYDYSDTISSSKQDDEPDHAGDPGGRSVWYRYSADRDGQVVVQSCYADFDAVVAAYEGATLDGLGPVGAPVPSSEDCPGGARDIAFAVEAGSDYWIAVDGEDGAAGTFELRILLAPVNDAFADARSIEGASGAVSAGNERATKEAGEGDHGGNEGGSSVWYRWTAPADGPAVVETCDTDFDTLLGVYTGTAVDATDLVAESDDSPSCGSSKGSRVEFDATAGTAYRIAVDGWGAAAGRFRVAVNPPANDRFAGAVDLADAGGAHEGTTVGATREAGEPNGLFGVANVWYRWTADVDGPVSIDFCRQEGYSEVRAYEGDALGSLYSVGTSESVPGCATGGTRTTFHAWEGTSYHFAVTSFDSAQVAFRIGVNAASNDDLARAEVLDGIDVSVSGTTVGSTREANEPLHEGEAGGHSVWYRWTAPGGAPGTVALDTCGSDFDTLLAVYRGSHYTVAPTLEPVEPSGPAPPCPLGEAGGRFHFAYEPGVTYRIAVDGADAAAGEFQLTLTATVPAPPNDDFVDAEPLDGLAVTAFGHTWSATREAEEPGHGGEGSASIWYSWTAPEAADVTIDTCGSSFDTLLGVYTGVALATLTEVGADDDSAACGGAGASALSIGVTAGTTYWLAVDGANGERGDVTLRVNRPPNDDFADATVVDGPYATVMGTTAGATAEADEPLPVTFLPAAHTVWYRWTAPASKLVLLHTCTGAGEAMDVRVYEGDALSSLTPGSFGLPSGGCGHEPLATATAVRSFQAIAGTTYSIAVDAPRDPLASFERGAEGPFTLAINPPANDLRLAARRVLGADASATATNAGATPEPGESDYGGQASGASVWFRWFAPAAGSISIDTCGSAMETLLTVEADDDGPQPPPPAPLPPDVSVCEEGEVGARHTFTTAEGRQYLIAVDGLHGATGNIELTIESDEEDVTPPETATTIPIPTVTRFAELYFPVTPDEPGSTFECSVDGGPFAACAQLPHDHSLISFGVLAEGAHEVALRERDLAGNVDPTPLEAELRVDLTPPDTEIVDAPEDPTRATTVSFVVESSEEGGHFLCSVDDAEPAFCAGDGNVQLSGLGEGSHTLRVWAVDEAGNEDPTPAVHEFTIDRTAPAVAIVSGPAGPTNEPAATFELESSEAGTAFRCRLQRSGAPVAPYADCESPYETMSLLDGAYTLSVLGVDAAGNESASASRAFVVDTLAPQTTFTQAPPLATNDPSPTFDFSADESAEGFRCALDDQPLEPCTSPTELGPLDDGLHTFEVEATDLAGNVETPPRQWIFGVDTVAPQTTIESGPEGLTRNLGPFSFSADEAGADFECAVDGDTYEPCSSPYTLPELADGAHQLSVRAVDSAGNVDPSAATRAIDLDRTAPTTTIDAGPEGIVGVVSVEFAFSADESAGFRCRLDGGPEVDCASPLEYVELDDGHHTFSVYAVDAAGNSEDPAVERAFRVEARPPETTLDATPAAYTAATAAEFEFSADEEDSTFDCSLDGEPLAPCESPAVYEDLADGEHSFAVRAVDVGDNADPTPAEFAWTVDTTAPETSIDSGPSGLTRVAGPFAFSANEPTERFECALDDGDFTPCSSGHTEGGLADGEHTLRVRAVDRADNVDASPAERQFTLDTVAPTVEITAGPGEVVGRDIAVEFAASEPGSSFECRLDAQPYTSCESPVEYEDLDEGPHSVRVRATDPAGNAGPAALAEFVVDVDPPQTTITAAPPFATNETSVEFRFTGTDVESFRCALDDAEFDVCSSPTSFENLDDGEYRFRVYAVDAAGNQDPTPAERSFTVDTVPPDTEITDGPDGPVHGQVSFSYSSSEGAGTFECSVNDGPFASCDLAALGAGEHVFRVRAVDPAGNRDPSPAERAFTIVNEKPEATLELSTTGGPARLDVDATFSGEDADDDELRYELQFGDGIESTGPLSDSPIAHRYDEPGVYTVRLVVDDDIDTTVLTRTVTVTLPEPLEPKAGDDQTVIAGEPVILDGADSRPLRGIDSYRWSFGDGSPEENGSVVQHTYEDPGTYEAELTVEGPGEVASDKAKIRVLPRPDGDGVVVDVQSDGDGVPGADVLVILPDDGERISAVTGATGTAKLYGLPDGEYKVYAYADGYLPATGNATAASGEGSGEVELTPGEVATAEVDSRRLTLDEIIAAGIDPNDPDNQHVDQFEVHLNVTNPRGIPPGGGGGGVGWGGYATTGGLILGPGSSCVRIDAYSCRVETGGVTIINRLYWDEDAPIISSLVIPFRATWLKEFYEVSLIVNNLGGEDFTLAGGNATITVPSGLSLAPTGEPQSYTTSVPDIPGGESRSARWILRGDKEGEYDLFASYAGSLEPFGRIVHIEGRTTDPIKVWGASALELEVAVDEEVRDGYPFTVVVNLKNASDVPVYNPAVELLKEGRVGYIEQPRQQRSFQVRELAPGDTHSAGPFVLVPEPSGDIDLANSFIRKTAGDVDLGGTIVTHERQPSFDQTPKAQATLVNDEVDLEWDSVAGVDGYEIYGTPDRVTDFPEDPIATVTAGPGTRASVPLEDDVSYYAISTVENGRREMIHPLAVSPTPGGVHCSYGTRRPGDANCDGVVRVAVLGDSYISGEGAADDGQPYRPGTDDDSVIVGDRDVCHRSERSWAVELGRELAPDAPVIDFQTEHEPESAEDGDVIAFLACSGAVAANLKSGPNGEVQYPAERKTQVDRLKELEPETMDVIFVSVGGNDAGFPDVVKTCLFARCLSMDTWSTAKIDGITTAGARAAEALVDLRVAAPSAELYRVGYPDPVRPLPDDCGSLGADGLVEAFDVVTNPVGYFADGKHKIDDAERRWVAASFLPLLNETVDDGIEVTGAHVLDVADAFDGNAICSDDPYAHGIKAGRSEFSPVGSESFHPTPKGQDALLAAVLEQVPHSHFGRNPNEPAIDFTPPEGGDYLEVAVVGNDPGSDVFVASDGGYVVIRNGPPNEVVVTPTFSLGSIAGRATTDTQGNATIPFRLGPSTSPGLHHVEVWTADGDRIGAAGFMVAADRRCIGAPDVDGDGLTDACDLDVDDGPSADADGDGIPNGDDGCPLTAGGTEDADGDGEFDDCDPDQGADPFSSIRGPAIPSPVGPPGAPRTVTATVLANGVVRAEWTAPAFDGGSEITGYEIAVADRDGMREAAADADSIELTGLAGVSDAKVVIRARNVEGVGAVGLSESFDVPEVEAPETTLDQGPPALTNDPTPTFAFSSPDDGATFGCRIDGGDFEPCGSPHTTAWLEDGEHTFKVRASDGAGNVDPSPVEHAFRVDTRPPETSIDVGPVGGVTIDDRTPTFMFSSDEPGSGFECKLDARNFAPCTSPMTLAELPDGSHRFDVRATDLVGNVDPTPASRSFTVNASSPPVTDSDGDGIGDSSDACPTQAGQPPSGCPPGPSPPISDDEGDDAPSSLRRFSLAGRPVIRNGKTILSVVVPRRGTLTASQHKARRKPSRVRRGERRRAAVLVRPVRRKVGRAGATKLPIRPTRAGKRVLRKRRKFAVAVRIVYRPTAGKPAVRKKRVVIRVKRPARRWRRDVLGSGR